MVRLLMTLLIDSGAACFLALHAALPSIKWRSRFCRGRGGEKRKRRFQDRFCFVCSFLACWCSGRRRALSKIHRFVVHYHVDCKRYLAL